MTRKLKVLGISTFASGHLSGQWRYIAAVHSQKEFAELVDCSLYYVRNYSSEAFNKREVGFAMKHPHKLIGVEPKSDLDDIDVDGSNFNPENGVWVVDHWCYNDECDKGFTLRLQITAKQVQESKEEGVKK